MPRSATNPPEIEQRRIEALERLQALQARVSARNQDLTAEQAESIAEELNQAAITNLREQGKICFKQEPS